MEENKKVTAADILDMHVRGQMDSQLQGVIISAMNEYASRSVLEYAQQGEPNLPVAENQKGEYSIHDILNFANWLRNGLTNLEYYRKDIMEHFIEWSKNNLSGTKTTSRERDIGFAKWINESWYFYDQDKDLWFISERTQLPGITSNKLYDLYLKDIEK